MPPADEPKIIIDSDWKAQAQAEKEKLAASKPKPVAKPAASPADPDAEAGDEEERTRFDDLVAMLASQALAYMGYVPDPRTGQAMVSLEYAKLHIDMLGVLEEKTKGNLSEAEQTALTRTASELRMAFVELSKAVAQAVAEGRIKPRSAAGGMGGVGSAGGIVTPGAGSGPKIDFGST
ncbi:MAG TPA: DUF1844 domain-containing protein [Phycisphaerales bacterium]|nr:DUF1844 domain-containing protein [Phycisphaerales bacterium]